MSKNGKATNFLLSIHAVIGRQIFRLPWSVWNKFFERIICKCIFPYGWFPFHLLMLSLAVQKLFILMKSHLFIISFMSLALGYMSVKILLCGISEIFPLYVLL